MRKLEIETVRDKVEFKISYEQPIQREDLNSFEGNETFWMLASQLAFFSLRQTARRMAQYFISLFTDKGILALQGVSYRRIAEEINNADGDLALTTLSVRKVGYSIRILQEDLGLSVQQGKGGAANVYNLAPFLECISSPKLKKTTNHRN